jgi:hypothetical protein
MKTTQKLGLPMPLIALAFLTLFSGMQCEKDFPPGTPEIDKLPTATQIGANTFGCLVDGKAFTPKGTWGSDGLQVYYQYVDNAYHFNIGVTRKELYAPLRDMLIRSHYIELQETTYQLGEMDTPGNIGSEYCIYNPNKDGFDDLFRTTSVIKGEITFTRFDVINQIVSGTFWFDAVNKDGKVVQVREGRFDSHFVL